MKMLQIFATQAVLLWSQVSRASRDMVTAIGLSLTALLTFGATMAEAAVSYLPTSVSDGFTQMQTDFGALTALIWPMVMLVAFTFLMVRLFKKGTGKAG